MKSKRTRRVLSALLTLGILLSLLPAAVSAETTDTSGALVLNKTATLEDDGTYTIRLEAYATGEVKTETTVEREPVPTDFILILDQSGSMDDPMTGIPSDTYDPATVTNANINAGSYYYKVGDQYYKVTATKELVSSGLEYVGDDGNIYQANELSTSWARNSDGQVYNTARPFVTASLKTFTRTHSGSNSLPVGFQYVNDADSSEKSGPSDAVGGHTGAAGGRYYFINGKAGVFSSYPAYGLSPLTAEFHNDGAPSAGDTNADDPYYVAASYIAVTQQEVNVYRYTYTYVDASGRTVTIGTSETGTEAAVDAANASIDLYIKGTTTGTRLDGLKYAANQFIDSIEATGVNHRVAVVGFASDGYEHENLGTLDWENTELFVGSTQYNYNGGNTGNRYAAAHYGEALQDVSTEAGKANVSASIDALANSGATFPQWGFTMAQGIFANSDSTYTKEDGTEGTRNRIVIFFTDGYPGYNYDNPDTTEANATVTKANTLKDTYGADVYCVACIESLTAGSDADTYLKDVSSKGDYQQATTAEALDAFFESIEKEVTDTTVTTSVTLTKDAVLVDELSSYFTVPSDFDVAENVTVQTAKHLGNESFANPTSVSGLTVTERTGSNGSVTGINVSGFDYLGDNMVTTTDNGTSVTATGNKLVVTITGLLAKDAAAMGVYVDTNTSSSGIWDKDSEDQWAEIKEFNVPHTLLDKKLFVLDYAKTTALDVYGATKIDSADDGLFSKVDAGSISLTGSYGRVRTSGGLSYTPNTTMWDGWDTFYALGKDAEKGDRTTSNIWSKVSVLPANNVYYEDTFVTNEATGTVGIVYSADGWETVTEGSNTGDANNDEHGWITSMNDDTGYSDGTVATGSAGATATFSFTGTGVDIYSRTNMTTGLIVAKLYKGEETKASMMKKSLTMDNLAQSGDYYQIPTVFFSNLDYGIYTVKLTVVATTEEERSTYYLDGIRVYNPLSSAQEQEDVVQEGYGDEIGATFQSVREILLDAESLGDKAMEDSVSGAVFIDYNPETEKEEDTATTATLGTYVDYGPKNEVYLAAGQAIAFRVSTEATKLSVGLKAPEGAATTAQVTNGANTSEIPINAASDQYFKIEPNADGYVVIKNTGDNLLSVTKLKTCGEPGEPVVSVSEMSVDAVMAYADSFDGLPVVAYTLMNPATDTDTDTDTDDTDTGETQPPEQGEVIIENPVEPEPEKPAEPVSNNWIIELIRAIRRIIRH